MGLVGFMLAKEGAMRDSGGRLPQSRWVGCRTEEDRPWREEKSEMGGKRADTRTV